jgi:GntR family transcriptional regulator, transcriptional repressor for pyruvate dehydrogenase complex
MSMSALASKTLVPVSRTSLVDEVIAAIKKMLNEKAWSPGTRLPSEQELARQLRVGRSTVREALRVLGHLGLVESKTGLGTYVTDQGMPSARIAHPRTPEVLNELYEFRRSIEIPAATLAAERRTTEEMAKIKKSWEACEAAVIKNSADEFARLDYLFHLSIVEASHNRFMVDAYRGLSSTFAGYVNLVLAQGPLRSMRNFHDKLIDAIDRRDPEAAARAVEENFVETDVRLRMLQQGHGDGTSKRRPRSRA